MDNEGEAVMFVLIMTAVILSGCQLIAVHTTVTNTSDSGDGTIDSVYATEEDPETNNFSVPVTGTSIPSLPSAGAIKK